MLRRSVKAPGQVGIVIFFDNSIETQADAVHQEKEERHAWVLARAKMQENKWTRFSIAGPNHIVAYWRGPSKTSDDISPVSPTAVHAHQIKD